MYFLLFCQKSAYQEETAGKKGPAVGRCIFTGF